MVRQTFTEKAKSAFSLFKTMPMFANDKSIDTLTELFREVKNYLKLQGEYTKLDLVEKLTILLSTLTLIFILIILGTMAAFYLSFMLVYVLASATGSLVAGYAIIGGGLILIALIVYRLRKRLIFQPMVNFLARLFLDNSSNSL